jgi:hypothetical protein
MRLQPTMPTWPRSTFTPAIIALWPGWESSGATRAATPKPSSSTRAPSRSCPCRCTWPNWETCIPRPATRRSQEAVPVGGIHRLLGHINQVLHNRDLALFYADHDIKLDEALALAHKEFEVRHDIYTWDALAWALYKNGKYQEASDAIDNALRPGVSGCSAVLPRRHDRRPAGTNNPGQRPGCKRRSASIPSFTSSTPPLPATTAAVARASRIDREPRTKSCSISDCTFFLPARPGLPAAAHAQSFAHPMGNFSVNHYSKISLENDGIRVSYIIDLAEIPTYQELQQGNITANVADPAVTSFVASRGRSSGVVSAWWSTASRWPCVLLSSQVIFLPAPAACPP